jgi:hypothetical protein
VPRHGQDGQALGEYAIVLALVSGVRWVADAGARLLDQPHALAWAGVAGLLVVAFVLSGRSGRW